MIQPHLASSVHRLDPLFSFFELFLHVVKFPQVEVIKLFSSSFTEEQNKLECFSHGKKMLSIIIVDKASENFMNKMLLVGYCFL